MDNLHYEAQIAIIKILTEILHADKVVHPKETEYLNEIILSYGLNHNYKKDLDNMLTLRALSIIRRLNDEQKNNIAQMMGNMIIVDGNINYNEVNLYNAFCESCGLEKDFDADDYPECSISGPFITPEELP